MQQKNQKVVNCDHCGSVMRLDRCPSGIYGISTIALQAVDNKTELVELIIFEDVLQKLIANMNTKVIDLDTKTIVENLLFLENITSGGSRHAAE